MDGCPNDPQKIELGACGCGVPDTDSDGDGQADCLNQAPVTLDQLVVAIQGQMLNIVLSASDADGDALTYALVSGPLHGAVTMNGSTAAYTPDDGYSGTDRITWQVNDGLADSNTATVTIQVQAQADDHTLTVVKTGNGQGSVTSAPSGINCGSVCQAEFETGTHITLIASPGVNSLFIGWQDAECQGADNCTITLNQDMTVNPAFITLPNGGGGSGGGGGGGGGCFIKSAY